MKHLIKAILCCGLTVSLLLTGCGGDDVIGTDTIVPVDTNPTDTPEADIVKHEISISEVESILAANGLMTNEDKYIGLSGVWHGGQQMRVCHTERGTYSAFASVVGETKDEMQKFYVAKNDSEGNSNLLYYGEFPFDDSEVTVNIGQDINGDIIVTTSSRVSQTVYIFDHETDEMTKYESVPKFSSEAELGYSQLMLDLENRKLYIFNCAGSGTRAETVGDSVLEWYSFDLDSKEWSDNSVLMRTEDIGRHSYLYPFPDGKGGAYIASIRNEYSIFAEGRFSLAGESYLWDRLGLFYIPDLTSNENTEYTLVQPEDDSLGLEGIWSNINSQNIDAYIDSNGYMHITYMFYLIDYTWTNTDFDNKLQYRHAVYNGMECVFNEKLEIPVEDWQYYRPVVRESTDGKLHLILVKMCDKPIQIDFYSAADDLGKSWKHEKNVKLEEGVTTDSLTVSGVREGSVQDNVLSSFFYGYTDATDKTGFTFNISLEDYSVTKLVNLLEGYDLQNDWYHDERIPYTDHQTCAVRTENGTYAAFVYNYSYWDEIEYYHIVKIDNDKNVTVLYSDSFKSDQNKSLTISSDGNGNVYVVPPHGRNVYLIDTATDEVTLHELTPILTTKLFPRQMSVVSVPETEDKYCISVLEQGSAGFAAFPLDSESMTIKLKNVINYECERELIGNYNSFYTLSDGKNGMYMVSTRNVTLSEDLDGKLEYNGYLKKIDDSVMMFYISDITDAASMKCIDIEVPYEDEGSDGIWSIVKINDVYLDFAGKLNVIYTYYHFDLDDKDRRENSELINNTVKHYLAVYDGTKLVSKDELMIDGLTKDTSIRMTEASDGTVYLLTCNLQRALENLGYDKLRYIRYPEGGEAKISVYCMEDDGWTLVATKELGEIVADGFFVSKPSGDDVIDCIVYASDNDVYYTNIVFEKKD